MLHCWSGVLLLHILLCILYVQKMQRSNGGGISGATAAERWVPTS